MWGPLLTERIHGWQRTDRFDEIRSAVDDALERFPEPSAVALVVETVKYINRSNADWDPKPADLDAWNAEVARRALDRLPRPPRVRDHLVLVEHAVLGGWRQARPEAGPDDDPDVGRDLALVARFVGRLLDDEDRLWRPLPFAPHDGRYAPVRRADPRFRSTGSWDTPADEEAFLAYEERWYERTLRDDEWRLLLDVQRQWSLLDVVKAFAARFPAASAADAALRERMPADSPEFPWIAVLDAARRQATQMPRSWGSSRLPFWVVTEGSSGASSHGGIGHDLALEVRVLNRTDEPTVIPLACVRAAIVHGPHDRDDEALPPPRAPIATELLTVAPGEVGTVRL
ncbi:MAG: hypothetical protein JNM10_08520, partial [Planctomycetia bacterium]|nr:hypothetical protein [Planctomycetia bacterium]